MNFLKKQVGRYEKNGTQYVGIYMVGKISSEAPTITTVYFLEILVHYYLASTMYMPVYIHPI